MQRCSLLTGPSWNSYRREVLFTPNLDRNHSAVALDERIIDFFTYQQILRAEVLEDVNKLKEKLRN